MALFRTMVSMIFICIICSCVLYYKYFAATNTTYLTINVEIPVLDINKAKRQRKISIHGIKHKKSWIPPIPAFMIIGTEKSGTSSLSMTLRHLPEFWAWNVTDEMRYFDARCVTFHPPDSFASYNVSLQNFYKKCTVDGFKGLFTNKFKQEHGYTIYEYYNNTNNNLPIYMYEKTPITIMFPHIAQIVVNRYGLDGTKFIVILRNPINRFISGFFEQYGYDIRNRQNALLNWLYDNVCLTLKTINKTIINCMKMMHDSPMDINVTLGVKTLMFNEKLWNILETEKQIDSNFVNAGYEYSNFLYWILGHFGYEKVKLIWLRGCYAPQIIYWLYCLDKLGLKHSLKMIQSELLFDNDSFQEMVLYLRCYVHFEINDDYDKWMKECMRTNSVFRMEYNRYHLRQKSKNYETGELELKYLKDSYKICNEWLKVLIDKRYADIILNKWEWHLWHS